MVKGTCDSQKTGQAFNIRRHNRRASGQRLRRLLHAYGVTPIGIAEFLGVSPGCVTNWFVRGIPRQRMNTIAQLLSVNVDWLSTGHGFDQCIGLVRKPVDDEQESCSIHDALQFETKQPASS